jgi:hypothetical protein
MKTIAAEAHADDTGITSHLERAAHHYEKAARHLREAAAKESRDHEHAADHHILVGSAHAAQARKHIDLAIDDILAAHG